MKDQMEGQKELYRIQADYCKFMANPKRLEILFLLGQGELCVDEIASAMGVKVPNISQHLGVMREKGIVECRRDGNKMYYSVANQKTLQACIIMRESMIEQMQKQYDKIKTIN